ncbi:hypothetical protein ACHAXA_008317 [Cyclostephanos tholiformis]|uniref:Uncharacterized protein n=1 Tax=Cyclostephanos tholiformis TaxID=382380 RepID=A0ABD3RSR2_9STRA
MAKLKNSRKYDEWNVKVRYDETTALTSTQHMSYHDRTATKAMELFSSTRDVSFRHNAFVTLVSTPYSSSR